MTTMTISVHSFWESPNMSIASLSEVSVCIDRDSQSSKGAPSIGIKIEASVSNALQLYWSNEDIVRRYRHLEVN